MDGVTGLTHTHTQTDRRESMPLQSTTLPGLLQSAHLQTACSVSLMRRSLNAAAPSYGTGSHTHADTFP